MGNLMRYQGVLPKSLNNLSTSRIESENFEGDGLTPSPKYNPELLRIDVTVLSRFSKPSYVQEDSRCRHTRFFVRDLRRSDWRTLC